MNTKNLLVAGLVGLLIGATSSYLVLNNGESDLLETNKALENEITEIIQLLDNREETIKSLEDEIRNLDSYIGEREEIIAELQLELENLGDQVRKIEDAEVQGCLQEDQIWSGMITVTDHIIVPKGVKLRILPGTIIQFQHYRGYKETGKRLGITIQGSVYAIGSSSELIYFTSDADSPINGDWGMIRFENTDIDSLLTFCVVEYGLQGINLWNSSTTISHSIVRWHNWEGIYLESYCEPLIAYNRIYQNGYNGIAMEQYNDALLIGNTISKSGTHGVHVDASKATIVNCNLTLNSAGGISVDDHGEVIAVSNTITSNGIGLGFGEGENKVNSVNNLIVDNFEIDIATPGPLVEFQNLPGEGVKKLLYDYPIPDEFALGYTPGDQDDQYMYVYPDVDETRKVVNKIGEGLGLTWSLAWDGEHIWTAVPWGIIYELNPVDGTVLKQFSFPGPQAWGMTFDGENLWVNDFAERKVYELDTEGNVLSSFQIPDETGGAKGITWDGESLYIMGWANPVIYKVDRQGKHLDSIDAGDFGGGLTWDGEYFWAPGGRGIAKISKDGQMVGSIYAASEGTWDLTWDGEYLWASQRTNENWMDAKIYQIEIIDIS